MNKDFLKKAAAVMTAAAMLSTTVFAAGETFGIKKDQTNYDPVSKKLTVEYQDAQNQASLLVFNISALKEALTDAEIITAEVKTEDIVAINQQDVNADGSGKFEETLPDKVEAGQRYAIKVGATDQDAPSVDQFVVGKVADIKYGDVDDDGSITDLDASYIYSYAMDKLPENQEPISKIGIKEFLARANVDTDAVVTDLDASYVYSYAMGKLPEFPNGGGNSDVTPSQKPDDNTDPTPTPDNTETTNPNPGGEDGTVTPILSVDTSKLTAQTYAEKGNEIATGLTVGGIDTGSVSVVEDAEVKGGKAIKIADTGAKQTSVDFNFDETAADAIIRYTASYKFDVSDTSGTDGKDAILVRFVKGDSASAPAVTDSDRVAEIKTVNSGTQYELKYSDYFTLNDTKATDTSTGIKLDYNKWYDITLEIDTKTKNAKIRVVDSEGKTVGSKEIKLPDTANITVKKATITTKGSNIADTDIYVANPLIGTADKSISLP